MYFEYYEPRALSVKWIYPLAGPKPGGSRVTLYGTGFKSLAHDILAPVLNSGGEAHSHRGLKCIFGDLPMTVATVVHPIGSSLARAALGDGADVLNDDDAPLAAAIECDMPPWSNASTYFLPPDQRDEDRCTPEDGRAQCEVDEPKSVCVRVTLNDDPHQHSGGCEVRYTYYDE